MWVSVGGDSASSLVFIGGCGAYAPLGAWSNSINILQSGVLIRLFLKKKGSNVVAACNESTAITAFGFLSWILCKCLVSNIAKKDS